MARSVDRCLTPHNLLQPVCQSVFGKAELFLMQLCECVRDWVIARCSGYKLSALSALKLVTSLALHGVREE